MVLLLAFGAVERRVPAPLVPPRVLGRRSVAWGNLAGLVAFLTETSLVFLLTLYLQEVLGFSPLAAGLSFGVLGAGTVVGGALAPRWIGRFGATRSLLAGGLVQAPVHGGPAPDSAPAVPRCGCCWPRPSRAGWGTCWSSSASW